MSDWTRSYGKWLTFQHFEDFPDVDFEEGDGDANDIEEEVVDVELCDDEDEASPAVCGSSSSNNDTVATGVEKNFHFKGTCIFIFFVVGSEVACVFS